MTYYGEERYVETYDVETLELKTSSRKYASVHIPMRDDSGWDNTQTEKNAYFDPATGRLVFDVEAYENWLTRIEGSEKDVLTMADHAMNTKEEEA